MFKNIKNLLYGMFANSQVNPRYKRIINLVILVLKDSNGFG
jgi:hypothetical protein